MKYYCWMFLGSILMVAVVNGKYQPHNKAQTLKKHQQRLEQLHKRAHDTANGDYAPESPADTESDPINNNLRDPPILAHHGKESNELQNMHGKSTNIKSHGQRKLAKGRAQYLKKSHNKDQKAVIKQERKDVREELDKPTRRVQKLFDDKQKLARKMGHNFRKDPTEGRQKKKNEMKKKSLHHRQTKRSVSKQHLYTKEHKNKHNGANEMKHTRDNLVHRMKKDQTQLVKDMAEVEEAQQRFSRDLHREFEDVQRLNNRRRVDSRMAQNSNSKQK